MPKFTTESFIHLEEILEEIALFLMPDVCPCCDEIVSDNEKPCPDCGVTLGTTVLGQFPTS